MVQARFVALPLSAVFLLALGSCSGGFDYLAVDGQTVSTTHGIPVELSVPDRFELMGEVHFQEAYGGPQFNISSVVYTTETELLAVHAEEHTDGTGGLDYTDLPADSLAGMALNSRVGCFDLSTETEEDLANNGFLRFLSENSYPFDRVLAMKQYFLTNPAGTAELVLSLAAQVASCEEGEPPVGVVATLGERASAAFGSLVLK